MSRVLRPVGPFADVDPTSTHRTAAGTTGCLASWRDMLREHFVALDVTDAEETFDSHVRSTLIGHVSASVVSSAPQSCVRTPSLAALDPQPFLQVGLVTRGVAAVEQDDRVAHLSPGTFAIYETDRPFTWHFDGPWQLCVLTWPRELVGLGADVTRSATARTLGADRLGTIVARTLAETVAEPPTLSPQAAGRFAGQLAALLGTVIGESLREDETLSPRGALELRRRVDAYVTEHVEDPSLGPEEIARAHFLSVRALHRVFADADLTVAALIRRRRVEHARRRLLDPRDAALSLTDIAVACGYTDLAAFSRRFKQAYHQAPGDYRRRAGLAP